MYYYVFPSVVLFVFGTIIGSFLNVVICRTPKKESVVKGRSHCVDCNHVLNWYDLFPVLSWVFLFGKCRYCKTKVSGRYALVEVLTGLSFAGGFLVFDFTLELVFALILFPVLICLSFFDIDTGEIEYWCPAVITALGLLNLVLILTGVVEGSWSEMLIGLFVVSVPFAILALFGAMGGADVQLMAAAGLLLGWNIVPAALIGIFIGAIYGIVLKARGGKQDLSELQVVVESFVESEGGSESDESELPARGTVISFGPFLAVGIAVGYLFGGELIGWYFAIMM